MCGFTFTLKLVVLLSLLFGIYGNCGPPPKLQNATPYGINLEESFAPGQSVTYKCLDGFYNIHGKLDAVTCLDDSQWTDIEEFCHRVCPKLPRTLFAKINRESVGRYPLPGSRVSYVCRPGYDIIPGVDPRITCLENYTWTAVPLFCKGKSCGDPGKPENGRATILTNVLFGARINFTCDDGFKLIGSPSAQCVLKENEVEWSNKPPECQRETVKPTGDADRNITGDCGRPPPVPHATLRTGTLADSYPVGTSLSYRCSPGYELIRGKTPVLTCLADSSWSDANPQFCQGRQCTPPTIENGDIRTEGDLRLGSEITYVCDHGYRRIGGAKARCMLTADNRVIWSTSPPRCERVQCFPPPEVENGRHSGEERPVYGYGDAVTYKCSKDYTLIGSSTISCMVSADGSRGEWRPNAPQCKVVSCPRPEISNGRLTTPFQATYGYEHTIGFVCGRGFTLVGSSTTKCGADSNWHPPVPTCVKGVPTTPAPTIRPDGGSTEGPESKPPPDETGSTETPELKPPPDGSESNNSIGIAVGTVIAVLLGIGLTVVVWICRKKRKNGKTEPPSQPSEDYREVSRNPDIVLESTDSRVP